MTGEGRRASGLTGPCWPPTWHLSPLHGQHPPLPPQWGTPFLILSGLPCPAQHWLTMTQTEPSHRDGQTRSTPNPTAGLGTDRGAPRMPGIPMGVQRSREGKGLSQGPTAVRDGACMGTRASSGDSSGSPSCPSAGLSHTLEGFCEALQEAGVPEVNPEKRAAPCISFPRLKVWGSKRAPVSSLVRRAEA